MNRASQPADGFNDLGQINVLVVEDLDVLDGTPLLDIMPYVE